VPELDRRQPFDKGGVDPTFLRVARPARGLAQSRPVGTPRRQHLLRQWIAPRHAAAAAFGVLVAPAARAASALEAPWLLFGAVGVGALIALGAMLIVRRAGDRHELVALRRTLAASADWWWRTGATLKIIEVGAGQRARAGIEVQRLIGRAPWEIAGADPPPPALAQAIEARAAFFDQLLHVRVDGGSRTLALSGTPLFSAGAQFEGYVGVARDMTDTLATATGPNREQSELIARLRAEGAERSRQFELAVKDLESFAHSVSHDLRAPLRVIDGFANIVLEDYGKRLDDLGREHVRRIVAAGSRMNSMIDTLLEMSRTTTRPLERERVDLSRMARELLEELMSQREVTEGPRNVECVIADGLVVDGDRTLLRLVLQNLLANAYKFTARQPVARIEVGVDAAPGRPAYFVRDNGAGFDMRFADKLFGLFQRFHSQNEFPGTGVGLATVHRIVRKHGGRIWAESAPGKGATFYFTLWE
jgi:signal transduction histidine kinase